MKEDVLEQVVDDYLKFNGYFTIHNVGFKPRSDRADYVSAQDSVGQTSTSLAITRASTGSTASW